MYRLPITLRKFFSSLVMVGPPAWVHRLHALSLSGRYRAAPLCPCGTSASPRIHATPPEKARCVAKSQAGHRPVAVRDALATLDEVWQPFWQAVYPPSAVVRSQSIAQ